MKTSKTTFKMVALGVLALGTIVGTAFPSLAQTTTAPTTARHHRSVWSQLNLTADQKAQIKTILDDQKVRVQEVKSNTSLSPADAKAQIKAIHVDTEARINAVLTPDQQAQLKQIRREERGDKRENEGFKELNLTADQKAQIKSIRETAKAQIEAIKSNTSLSPAEQQAQIKTVRRSSMQSILALLTPEQQAQLKQWRREHRENRAGTAGNTASNNSAQSNYSRPSNGGLNG